jgi:ribosomal protein S18 acetylase RimI-like enzyme
VTGRAGGPGYRLTSLADLSLTALIALVNAAYAGYPGPFTPEEPAGYAAFLRTQDIDLWRSRCAHDARGAPIGLALLGIRAARAWIGDFGVIPAWRRAGVGRALLGALLDSARAAGVGDVRLEVARGNAPARRLYAGAGFAVTRTLHNYAARAGVLALGEAGAGVEVAPGAPDLLLRLDLGLPPTPPPAWDHELPTLLTGIGPTLLATRDGAPVGLLQATGPPDDIEIRRLVVRPGDSEVARALLRAACRHPDGRVLVAYEDGASPLALLWPALGFQELEPDLEMARAL